MTISTEGLTGTYLMKLCQFMSSFLWSVSGKINSSCDGIGEH